MMYQSKYNDDWKPEAFKLWNVSVSAKPKSNVVSDPKIPSAARLSFSAEANPVFRP